MNTVTFSVYLSLILQFKTDYLSLAIPELPNLLTLFLISPYYHLKPLKTGVSCPFHLTLYPQHVEWLMAHSKGKHYL